MGEGQKKLNRLYRCNGKKCESGQPLCFYTADPAYAGPLYVSMDMPDEPDEKQMEEWTKQVQELAEWQTFLPVEKRMPCKRGLPVIGGLAPDRKEEGGSDGSV